MIYTHLCFTYFKKLILIHYSCVWSFVFNKTYFWILYQKHRYIIYMCIGFYPYTICFKCVSISCFRIYTSLGKIGFPFQNLVFEKYGFCLRPNILYHKNSSNSLQYVLMFCHTYLLFKYLQELIFVKFMRIYGILLELNCLNFQSFNLC